MTFISGLVSPRDHENKAVNGGLPLTEGPLTQVDLVLEKAYGNLGPKQSDCSWQFAVNAGTERTRILLYHFFG